MKRFLQTALSHQKFLFLMLLPLAVKMQEDYCSSPEDSTKMAIPFRLLYKNVCPLIKDVLFEATYNFRSSCAQKCSQNPFCAGLNFKKMSLNNIPNCQLTHTFHHNFDDCNADDKGWNFYHPVAARKIPCHKRKNCKNEGKAIIDLKGGPGSDPYMCECPTGYRGDLCQIDQKISESVILSGDIHFNLLKSWIGGGLANASLCWRATRDGWAASTFHSRCDNKKPTVTLVKVGSYIFGGYATESWEGDGGYKQAQGSFIFSLRNKENLLPFKAPLKNQNSVYAIYAYSSYGPTFGGGHDFHISNNAASNTNSYTNFNHYYQPPSGVSDADTILAGTYSFTPSEVEVFYLV